MKSPVLFFIILSFFISCAGNTDTEPADVSGNTTTVNVEEVDSVEIKKIAEEEAAKIAAAEEERAQAEKDSIAQVEKELAEVKEKKAREAKKKKEAAARAAAEAAKSASIPISELPVSQPVVKPAPRPVAKPAPKKGPKITFAKKSYNFGTIKEGDVVKYEFEYTNTGSADLVIKDASASCGCTAPGFSFFPLEPGLSSAISVTFNSKNKLGAQRPQVTIKTNGYPSTHILTMEGVVEK